MSHKADALIVTCMDYRLHTPAFAEFLRGLGIASWDLRTQQGGVRDLLPTVESDHQLQDQGEARFGAKRSLLDAVRIAMELHGVTEVFLMNHGDCGAYGGAHAFDSPGAERAQHQKDLAVGSEELRHHFPGLRVRRFFVDIDSRDARLSFLEVT